MTSSRPRGFTLIEVLIGITLLGVMVTLLFASLRIAAESWHAGEDKIAGVNQKAVVYQFFKRHLSTIRPLTLLEDAENPGADGGQIAFQGLPQRLRFAAALPAASLRKGLQVFTIEIDPRQSTTLQVALKPYQPSDDESAQIDPPVILLKHVEHFRLSYFGKREDEDDARWHEEWASMEALPSLIKVVIELEDHSYWPEMVFPLKINAVHNAEVGVDEDTDDEITSDGGG